MAKPEWLDRCTILRGVVGSTAHGTSLTAGDQDEIGICIEPIEAHLTLGMPFEQYVYRTATERTGIADAPSQPGDIDLTVYGLRQFCRLAAKGNPTILLAFYLPNPTTVSLGLQLREMAPLFISKDAGKCFLGYMQAQRQRLLGERGQKRVKRPDLEEKYGFDTKYAYHILRLGLQGIELLTAGKLSLPMSERDREYLLNVRRGAVTIDEVLNRSGEMEHEIKDLLTTAPVPDHADVAAIESWLQKIYVNWWAAHREHGEPMEPHWMHLYKPKVELT